MSATSHLRRRSSTAALALSTLAALVACSQDTESGPVASPSPTEPTTSTSATAQPDASDSPGPSGRTRVLGAVAQDLEVPWGLDATASGDVLVTERDSGRVLALRTSEGGEPAAPGSDWNVNEIARLEGGSGSEGGILGITSRPLDKDKPIGPSEVFVMVTTAEDNRVLRGTWNGNRIDDFAPVLTGIPRGEIHDGGRIEFGPDGHLYVATGDAGRPELAQDRDSMAGKILRVTADGDPAPDNPFGTEVWSYGHRNVQGLAWDDDDQLWATEFGQNTSDELNRVVRGGNHGWPLAEGDNGAKTAEDGTTLVAPVLTWPTDRASPSGLAWAGGRLWVAGLRGERLWEVTVDTDGKASARARLEGRYGRLRSVIALNGDRLWVSTSNRDGRGDPARADDRIIELRLGAD